MVTTIDGHGSTQKLLDYMFKKKGFAVVFSTLFAKEKADMVAEIEGRMALNANPQAKMKLLHIIHSGHTSDNISPEAWKQMCDWTVEMYGKGAQVKSIAGMHYDTDETHCHQLLCVVLPNGRLCDRSYERPRIRKIDNQFEEVYHTTKTRNREREKLERELAEKAYEKDGIIPPDNIRIHTLPLDQGEIEKARRLEAEGLKDDPVPDRLHLQKDIEVLVHDCSSWEEFEAKGKEQGIEVRPWKDKDGVITGVSFAHGDVKLKGSLFGLDGKSVTKIFNHKQFAAETDKFDGEPFGHGYVPASPEQEVLISKIGFVADKATSVSEFELGLDDAGIPYSWKYDKEGKRTNIEYGEDQTRMSGSNAGYNIRQIQAAIQKNNLTTNQQDDNGTGTEIEHGAAQRADAFYQGDRPAGQEVDDFLGRHGGTNRSTPGRASGGNEPVDPRAIESAQGIGGAKSTGGQRTGRPERYSGLRDAQRATRARIAVTQKQLHGFEAVLAGVGSALVTLLKVLNGMQLDTNAPRPSRPVRPVYVKRPSRPRPSYQPKPPRRPRPGHDI